MGKTLLGIDLEESPAGGLVERLLTEEELEALADGGREPRDEDDEDDTEHDADEGDAADHGSRSDAEDGAVEVDVESDAVDVEVDVDSGEVEVDVDRDDDSGAPSLRDRFPSIRDDGDDAENGDDAANGDVDDGTEDEDGSGGGGIVARVRPHLLKIVAGLVVVAVVGLVLWRYLDTITSVVGGKLGRGGDGDEGDEVEVDVDSDAVDVSVDVDADAPAARRRAKSAGVPDETPAEAGTETDDEGDDEDDGALVGDTGNSDAGALVGLAFLALVAALVRKLTEEREHDPLVDGPE